MNKVTPFLWFDNNAEEAVNFYASIFKNVTIGNISRYSEAGPLPAGTVMTISFEIEGQAFTALNGGPHYTFTPAVSFVVMCEDQDEVDRLWNAMAEGGRPDQCGWISDRFGVTWQIVPRRLIELLTSTTPGVAGRVAAVMMPMKKLIIADLEAAAKAS